MKLSQEHKELIRTIHNFVDTEINPYIAEWEQAGLFPMHDIVKKMGELGLLGIDKPVEYGGLGLDYSYAMVANEALGRIRCGGVNMALNVQTCMATPALAKFGSAELCEQFLAPAIAGDQVCAIAVSEVSGGSDVAALKTTAVSDGDDYIINGSKMWITNATQADWVCLLCNTSEGKPHQNKSLIVVPTNLPGFSVGEKLDKLGMRSSDTAPIYLDNVRVPKSNLVGEEGQGFIYQMIQFQEERLSCISSLASLEWCVEETINYCREREIFGQPLIDNQVVHYRMAELKTEIELLRSLFYRAADEYVAGNDVSELASMAKLKIGRLSRELTDACLQYWGGNGFMWDNPVSQFFRDNRLLSIGGGADEVMLSIICKYMGIAPSKKKK
ncbi:citronellyl-CoA dehydrogenase [Sinobacterium caligoides]|uniref:Citronellyl-CoA dehydrogenase n=1 Tax=Sinobacterium caligoides TaxID=933926 RepID=A0A3N2DR11_9GAMM|nr:acyl-CoA dehydrogenase family protein [Sinobacterium caligoides]ROS01735.1 citronellyl-CoA dehydrogenase [Sinobacterium caligoides]